MSGHRRPAAGLVGPPPAPVPRDPLRRVVREMGAELPRAGAGVLLGFLTVACGIGLMATSAYLLQSAALHPPVLSLTVAIVGVRFFGLARGILRYTERLTTHDAALRIVARLRVRVFGALEPLAPGGLGDVRSGDLLRRLVADVDALQDLTVRALAPPAVALSSSALAVGLVAVAVPAAAAVLAAALLVGGAVLPAAAMRLGRRASADLTATRATISAEVADLLRGGPELAAWGATERFIASVAEHDDELRHATERLSRRAAALEGLGVVAAGAAVVGVLAVGTSAVGTGFDPLHLGLIALGGLAAFEAVAPLPAAFQTLSGIRASATRLYAIVDRPAPVADPADPVPLPVDPVPAVRVEDLTVVYPDRTRPALAGARLTLAPGRRVAVVGQSGSGKSTLVAALLRFVEPHEGRITVGGVDVRHLAQDDVRRLFAVAAQDSHVFATTIRGNVRIGRPEASDDEVDEVLRRVRLDDWIAGLPEGPETYLGDDGVRASGGQRQRLVLARALVSDAPYLILDEPTAHLDEETAAAVMRDVVAALSGRGLLLVTHRSDDLAAAAIDQVVNLAGPTEPLPPDPPPLRSPPPLRAAQR